MTTPIMPIIKGTYIFEKGTTWKTLGQGTKQIMENITFELKFDDYKHETTKPTIPVLTLETGEIEDVPFNKIYWEASSSPSFIDRLPPEIKQKLKK